MREIEHPPLDAEAILAVLGRHDVAFVVVGGYAAELHGSLRRTVDVDVVPETSTQNLTRLAAALRELGARIRTDAEPLGLPFATSAAALTGLRMLNLVTSHGELDLTFRPSGTEGYDDLARAAERWAIGRVTVSVASLDDVIRSKRAAGRRKDIAALPELERLATGSGSEHLLPSPDAVDLDESPRRARPARPDAAARIAAARAQAAHERGRRSASSSDG